MVNIIEAGNLPENEKVYLKHSFDGWRVVHPWKIDGKICYNNVITGGSWWNLVKVAVIVLMILFFVYSYKHDIAEYKKVSDNPCLYCASTYQDANQNNWSSLDISGIKLEVKNETENS